MAATVSFRNDEGWIDKRGVFDIIFEYALMYLDKNAAPTAVREINDEMYMLSFDLLPLAEQRELLKATERGLQKFVSSGPSNPDVTSPEAFQKVADSGRNLVVLMKASLATEVADPSPDLAR